jgi:isopentenyl-diphosphate delta-isomerase type 1
MSMPIQIVDAQDHPVRAGTKEEVWSKGLMHRVVRVMLEDAAGRVLLQHRDPKKTPYPNCWDNSVAGHVDAGEDYEAAVYRELAEELGITDLPLQKVGDYYAESTWNGRAMKRFTRVYKAVITQLPDKLGKDEVDAVRWFTVDEVKALIRQHPDQVTDGLDQVFGRFY